jgi:hypothetical protein
MEISRGIDIKIDLGKISHVGDAAYDSYENQRHRSCLSGTRVDLLRETVDWATCMCSGSEVELAQASLQ